MADSKKENIIAGFPNPLETEDEKAKAQYGLDVAKAIFNEANGKSNSFFSQRKRVVDLRNVATDTPSNDKNKDQDAIREANTSYLNLNFTISTVIPNLVNISSNKLRDRGYEISLNSIDKDSFDEFDKKMKAEISKVRIRKAAEKMVEQGQDSPTVQAMLSDTADASSSVDDAVLDLEMNFKTEAEEAYEAALRYTFSNNSIEEVEKVISRDLHVLQRAGAMVFLDDNGDVKIDWVDIKNIVTGYCTHADYSDCRYVGVVRELKLSEVKAMSNGVYSDQDYFNMARKWTADFGNDRFTLGSYYNDTFRFTQFADFKVLVLFYQIKLPNTKVWRTKKSKKGNTIEHDQVMDTYTDTFTGKDGEEQKKRGVIGVDRKEVVDIYEGHHVCNSKYSWGWKKKTNMTRKVEAGTYSTDTDFDIILYAPQMQDMTTKGMVERMSPLAEEMTLIDLKLQQLVAKSRPPGVVLDVAALQGISMGIGNGFVDYKDTENIYNQVGNLYINSKLPDGTDAIAGNSPIVTELNNGLSSGIDKLIVLWNQKMMQIYQISGINPAVDGSMPSNDSLVGIAKAQEAAYNSAVKHLFDGYVNIMQRIAERAILLIQNQMDMGVKVIGYRKAIGAARTTVMKVTSKMKMSELGIIVQFKPTAGEKQDFLDFLALAIKSDQVSAADAMRAKEMIETSAKEASEFLARKIDRYARDKSKLASQAIEAKEQSDTRVFQAKAQGEIQSAQVKSDGKLREIEAEGKWKIDSIHAEYDRKERLVRIDGEVKEDLIEKSADVESESTDSVPSGEGMRTQDSARKRKEVAGNIGVDAPRINVKPADDVAQSLRN